MTSQLAVVSPTLARSTKEYAQLTKNAQDHSFVAIITAKDITLEVIGIRRQIVVSVSNIIPYFTFV